MGRIGNCLIIVLILAGCANAATVISSAKFTAYSSARSVDLKHLRGMGYNTAHTSDYTPVSKDSQRTSCQNCHEPNGIGVATNVFNLYSASIHKAVGVTCQQCHYYDVSHPTSGNSLNMCKKCHTKGLETVKAVEIDANIFAISSDGVTGDGKLPSGCFSCHAADLSNSAQYGFNIDYTGNPHAIKSATQGNGNTELRLKGKVDRVLGFNAEEKIQLGGYGGGTSFGVTDPTGSINVFRISRDSGPSTYNIETNGDHTAIRALSRFSILTTTTPPASATAVCTTGEIRFDATYFYRCVATNTWKRTSLTTW